MSALSYYHPGWYEICLPVPCWSMQLVDSWWFGGQGSWHARRIADDPLGMRSVTVWGIAQVWPHDVVCKAVI